MGGEYTPNLKFYELDWGAFGPVDWTRFNAALEATDADIAAMETSQTALNSLVTGWAIEDNMVTLVPLTPTYVDADTFTLPADYTSRFTNGKVVQARVAGGLVESTVDGDAVYAAGVTTVNLADAVLTDPITRVYVVATRDGLWPNGPGYIVARDDGVPGQAAWDAAIARIGILVRTLVLTHGAWGSPSSDVPANITTLIMPGAVVDPVDADISFLGPVEAPHLQWIDISGTGSISFAAGTVKEIEPDWWYDGGGDYAAAITAAVAAGLASGAPVVFSGNTSYTVITSTINTGSDGQKLKVVFEPGASIDASASAASPVIKIQGSLGTFYLLGASPVAGDIVITVDATLVATLAEGDTLLLTTEAVKGGSGEEWGNSGLPKGEMVEVKSISGNDVTIRRPLYDSYTAANTVCCKMALVEVELNDFNLTGDASNQSIGMQIWYGKQVRINQGNITGFSYACLSVNYCIDVVADQLRTYGPYNAATGTNYGLSINSCQDVNVSYCSLYAANHALEAGGWIPNRNMKFGPGNTIDNDENASSLAVGFHGNAEYYEIFGNSIKGGIVPEGRNFDIHHNDVGIKRDASYALFYNAYMDSDYSKFRDNNIIIPASFTGAINPVQVTAGAATATIRLLDLSGNVVNCPTSGALVGIRASAIIGLLTVETLKINNATLTNEIGALGYLVKIHGYDASNVITINKMQCRGGDFYQNCTYGIYALYATIGELDISNDWDVSYASGYPIKLDHANLTINKIHLVGNRATNSANCLNFVIDCGSYYVEVSDNYFDGFAGSGLAVTATEMLVKNNKQGVTIGNFTITGKYYSEIFGDGNVISWGTAAPTNYHWRQGDRIRRTNSTSAQEDGWECTVTGEFGAATDNTGDTTIGSATITGMTDTSDFNVGGLVNCSAGFAVLTGKRIVAKTSTSLTLDAAANSNQSNITVDTSDPVFVEMPDLK